MALTFSLSHQHLGNTGDLPLGGVKEQEKYFLPVIQPTSTAPSLQYRIESHKQYTREVGMQHVWW